MEFTIMKNDNFYEPSISEPIWVLNQIFSNSLTLLMVKMYKNSPISSMFQPEFRRKQGLQVNCLVSQTEHLAKL